MHLSRRQALSSLGAILTLPVFSAARSGARPRTGIADTTRFLNAVRTGDLGAVRSLLEKDATLAAARDGSGRTAFLLAHVHGHEDVATSIRERGIDLDLVEAVLAEDWERFDALAKAHPERLNAAHPVGGTPLYGAALVGSLDSWRLRSAGCAADAAPTGGTGFTPARGAMESPHAVWARISLTDLCGNGADVNAPQRDGSSVLHGAVERRDEVLVRLAIRKGADVDARDAEGRTAEELGADLEWSAGKRLLAEHHALPRDNRASRFALDANRQPVVRPDISDVPQELQSRVTGSSHGNLGGVRELVSKDERLIFSISTDDELAIEACAHTGNAPIMRYHLDHGAPLSLPTAVSLGNLESVGFWLERDATLIHERGAHDFPVMWYVALGAGQIEMAELLTHFEASPDQESKGTTALHWCVRRNRADLAKWLLENGANPEPVGYQWSRAGQTPLQLAQEADLTPMIGILKAAGARR